MNRSRGGLAACLAVVAGLIVCEPAGASLLLAPTVGAADNGEVVVLSGSRAGALQASIGTPGVRFVAPMTLAPPGVSTFSAAVAMDSAGDAVVVWESVRLTECYKGSCFESSLGVFASLRPAGGSFGAPLVLAPAMTSGRAYPRLAMNRRGDWLVAMGQGGRTVVAAGRRATPPSAAVPIPVAELGVDDVALDEAGNATLSGTSAKHPSAVVRNDDGSYAPLEVLDGAEASVIVGVGPRGDGVAVWRGAGRLRFASRAPGGRFEAPVTSDVAADNVPVAIGIDGRGRTMTVFGHQADGDLPLTLLASRGTVRAPFGPLAAVSDPAGNADIARFAMAADGSAVLTWSASDRRYSNRVVQAAFATACGSFAAPLTVTRPNDIEADDRSDAAIDSTGRAVLVWRALAGDVGRLVAATLSSSGLAAPTVVTPEPQIVLDGRGHALPGQTIRVRRDGTLRPLLKCVSLQPSCRGTLRIDTERRFGRGRSRVRVGTATFTRARGTTQQVRVRVSRAARRLLTRRSLRCTVLVRSRGSAGGWLEDTARLTIKRKIKRGR